MSSPRNDLVKNYRCTPPPVDFHTGDGDQVRGARREEEPPAARRPPGQGYEGGRPGDGEAHGGGARAPVELPAPALCRRDPHDGGAAARLRVALDGVVRRGHRRLPVRVRRGLRDARRRHAHLLFFGYEWSYEELVGGLAGVADGDGAGF